MAGTCWMAAILARSSSIVTCSTSGASVAGFGFAVFSFTWSRCGMLGSRSGSGPCVTLKIDQMNWLSIGFFEILISPTLLILISSGSTLLFLTLGSPSNWLAQLHLPAGPIWQWFRLLARLFGLQLAQLDLLHLLMYRLIAGHLTGLQLHRLQLQSREFLLGLLNLENYRSF